MVQHRQPCCRRDLAEYGLVSVESHSLCPRPGNSLNVSCYQMKDASGAYGLYSYLRRPDMRRANFTEHSSISDDRALILVGNLILDISGKGLAVSSRDLPALVAAVSAACRRRLVTDASASTCPKIDRVDVSDRYVLGPADARSAVPGRHRQIPSAFNRALKRSSRTIAFGGHDATLLIVATADRPACGRAAFRAPEDIPA